MLYKAFESLLVIHDHPHIELNLIAGMLSCKIFNQLHGLSYCQISILYMDPNILEPGLEDQISCGRVATLQFINLCLAELAEFMCSHLHAMFGWANCTCKETLSDLFLLGEQAIILPNFCSSFQGCGCKTPLLTACKAHMVG